MCLCVSLTDSLFARKPTVNLTVKAEVGSIALWDFNHLIRTLTVPPRAPTQSFSTCLGVSDSSIVGHKPMRDNNILGSIDFFAYHCVSDGFTLFDGKRHGKPTVNPELEV